MRKRLRKKRHLGEFRQFGFSLNCRLREGISILEFNQFADDFITDAIEARNLNFGGGGSPSHGWSGVVCREHSSDSPRDEDRIALQNWLDRQGVVESVSVSEFWDVWHGHNPFDARGTTSAVH